MRRYRIIIYIVVLSIIMLAGCSKEEKDAQSSVNGQSIENSQNTNMGKGTENGQNTDNGQSIESEQSTKNGQTSGQAVETDGEYNKNSTVVLQVGKDKIYLNEMLFNVGLTELEWKSYETKNGIKFWDMDYKDGISVREYLKDTIMENAIRTEVLYQMAQANGDKLTEDEEKDCLETGTGLMNYFTEEQKDIIGITEKQAQEIQKKIKVCSNYYEKWIENYKVDEEAIKESLNPDDYKQYDIQYLFAAFTKMQDGKAEEYSKVEKDRMYDTLNSLKKSAADTDNLRTILSEEEQASGYYTMKQESFAEGDNTMEDNRDLERDIVNMKVKEVKLITTKEGYYLVKLVDNTSMDSYNTAVEHRIEDKQYEDFDKEYSEMKKKYKITINDVVWDSIIVGNTTINREK